MMDGELGTRAGGFTPIERRRGRRTYGLASCATVVVAALIGASGIATADTPTVQTATNPTFGTILTTNSGMALYTLDTDHNGQSTCHGACAAAWPPLDVPAGTVPTGGPGVTGTVGAAEQSNGTFQVTYNGDPVYTFVSDSTPGQVTGNNVAGFLVVTVAPSSTTTTSPSTAPGATPTTPGSTPSAGTTASPAPATAPGSSAPSASPGATSATSESLAFTGTGPVWRWLLIVGLVLLAVGTLVMLGQLRRTRNQN
jgi:predicted lipoprotein with Yx(FWY)xxD motif